VSESNRYVVNYKKRRITKNDIFTKILSEIDKTNGEIKFASATFELVGAPDLRIKLEKDVDL